MWEWCQDWFDGDYYSKSPAFDPAGPKKGLAGWSMAVLGSIRRGIAVLLSATGSILLPGAFSLASGWFFSQLSRINPSHYSGGHPFIIAIPNEVRNLQKDFPLRPK